MDAIPQPPPTPPSGGPRTGIEVTTKFRFLQWILYLVTPTVVIDGRQYRQKWGTYFFDLAPGRHQLEVYFRYLFSSRAGANSVNFDLASGQARRFLYRAPWIVFMKGEIKEQ